MLNKSFQPASKMLLKGAGQNSDNDFAMKNYELAYLISTEVSEEELKKVQEKINSLVQSLAGVLIETNSPIKKLLAYPIKKKSAAYLATLNFQLEPKKLANIEKELKSESKILRYLILTKKLPKKVVAVPIRRPEKIIKPKVELKEIEKKLEEILGET